MMDSKIYILSLVLALVSGQSLDAEKAAEVSGRSRQPEGEGRFLPIFGGFGGVRPGGFLGGGLRPGLFGGYYPGAYRPVGYRPGGYRPGGYYPGGGYPGGYFGGYPPYPRPGFGNRPFGGLGAPAAAAPSPTRPVSNTSNQNRPGTLPNLSNLTPSQAALLGQALGASLRPFLNGGGGAGASGSANQLTDILSQLG